jgi:hypothetical protein
MAKSDIKLHTFSLQSSTGHPNQIHKTNQRQLLNIVSQSLQIIHEIYRNLSRRGHKKAQFFRIELFLYSKLYF